MDFEFEDEPAMVMKAKHCIALVLRIEKRPALTALPKPSQPAKATPSRKHHKARTAPKSRQAPGAVSGRVLDAIRAGQHDVNSIASSLGAKPGSVRQALHGLLKKEKPPVERIGRGRFGLVGVNGAAAHA